MLIFLKYPVKSINNKKFSLFQALWLQMVLNLPISISYLKYNKFSYCCFLTIPDIVVSPPPLLFSIKFTEFVSWSFFLFSFDFWRISSWLCNCSSNFRFDSIKESFVWRNLFRCDSNSFLDWAKRIEKVQYQSII